MLKICGIILVIFASSKIGFDMAKRLEIRRKSIASFIKAFTLLKSEIGFAKKTPSKAFGCISSSLPKQISNFLTYVSKKIEEERQNVESAWAEALAKYAASMCLKESDICILREFSLCLGKYDVENELKNIHSTIECLDVQLLEAKNESDTSKKMYQSAGVLGGILLAILLI